MSSNQKKELEVLFWNNNRICIRQFESDEIRDRINEINMIDSSLRIKVEDWNLDNFLYDLPDKWALSHFAFESGRMVGYIICSKKKSATHIHRFVVSANHQHRGIGSCLLAKLFELVGPNNIVTLKVKKYNHDSILFYEKKGFVKYAEEDVNYLYKKVV